MIAMPSADDRYRAYLLVLARREVGRAAGRLDPSGVVQQTLLEAHAAGDGFAALESAQRLAWLRTALARNLADEYRKLHAGRRDVRREVEASAAALDGWLAAQQSSPSEKADRNEQLLQLAAALEALPETQRAAVEAHYFEGRPVADVAAAMGKTTTAVAGLLKRGLQNLRDVLREPEG
jgi:RNA polymerase sigma-70 factor, ECF subfamily